MADEKSVDFQASEAPEKTEEERDYLRILLAGGIGGTLIAGVIGYMFGYVPAGIGEKVFTMFEIIGSSALLAWLYKTKPKG